jgi:hypothetical protein
MNPEIRARWTTALRSGNYQQGSGALREKTAHNGEKLCCLGVLCVIAEQDGVVTAAFNGLVEDGVDAGLWAYDGRPDYLPESVKDWAGLTYANPTSNGRYLANLNDEGWSFARIADAIDGGASR